MTQPTRDASGARAGSSAAETTTRTAEEAPPSHPAPTDAPDQQEQDRNVSWRGAAATGVALATLALMAIYALVKIWPHPTPSGRPVTPDTTATRQPSRTDTGAARADSARPRPSATRLLEPWTYALVQAPSPGTATQSQASPQPPARGTAPSTPQAPPSEVRGVPGHLWCDTVAQKHWVPTDSLKDPECVSIFRVAFPIWNEQRLLLIVILSGALGGFFYALKSLYWYTGNRKLKRSWLPMYFIEPLTGMILAVALYLVVRGGFFSANSSFSDTSPFGMAALAILAGMFSRQAFAKLERIANTVFEEPAAGQDTLRKDEKGAAAAPAARPTITSLVPNTVVHGAGDTTVTVTGTGFSDQAGVKVSGVEHRPKKVHEPTRLEFVLPATQLAAAADLQVSVTTPSGGESNALPFKVTT